MGPIQITSCGDGGIRTLEAVTPASLARRYVRPLRHVSIFRYYIQYIVRLLYHKKIIFDNPFFFAWLCVKDVKTILFA
jgi:hypothetical protein